MTTTPGGAREVARRVLDRIESDGAWATPALDGELEHAGLDERDRRLAAELVYGVLRHRARIDRALTAHATIDKTHPKIVTVLRVAAYQILLLDRVPGYAAVDDAVAAAAAVAGPKLGGFVNAVLRKLTTEGEPPMPAGDIEVRYSLPRWILDELKAASRDGVPSMTSVPAAKDGVGNARGAELAALAAAFAESAPIVARVNARRGSRDEVAKELEAAGVTSTPIASAPMALELDGLGDPAQSPTFKAGKWTVQDTGAQHVALVAMRAFDSLAGRRILDACAGVGGKSAHLAELTNDAAQIDAADISSTKLSLAAEIAERMGLTSIVRIVCDLLDPAAPLAAQYDLIILDAPCSGLGVLRRHPDAKWRLGPDDVPRLAHLQKLLLDAVVPRLAPGGTLVYSVCTFTRAEGPEQVKALVARTGLRLIEEHRTWPPEADAFYLARLVRESRE